MRYPMGNTITILTDLFDSRKNSLVELKEKLKGILKYNSQIRGPNAVVQSFLNGCRKNGVTVNCNPKGINDVAEVVVVLSGIPSLRQAIAWKKEGRIKRLLAGPNLVVLPSDNLELIIDPAIDYYLVNSQWTYDMYIKDAPALLNRCLIWPAGVDVAFWKPDHDLKEGTVLIYEKAAEPELMQHCNGILQGLGYKVLQLKYGQYTSEQYLRKLRESEFAVFFSRSESQGIGLLEAWAVNVPTLVWNPGSIKIRDHTGVEKIWVASSAPYLSDQTGLFFKSGVDFTSVVGQYSERKGKFSPRHWVLENMTDELSAKKICCYSGIIDSVV